MLASEVACAWPEADSAACVVTAADMVADVVRMTRQCSFKDGFFCLCPCVAWLVYDGCSNADRLARAASVVLYATVQGLKDEDNG